jgi:S-adenosylmethionine synthetase
MARLFTSEAVCVGHPDKVCDQISDAILDAYLKGDPHSRVACETAAKTGIVFLAGEITSKTVVNLADVTRETIREIGYADPDLGFDHKSCGIIISVDRQSPDIAIGVDENAARGKELGAGDQGIMYGYACRETDALMPLPIHLARGLVNRLREARERGELPYLRPDGKAQVTVAYEGGRPVRVQTVVVSTQHAPDVGLEKLRRDVEECVVRRVIPSDLLGAKVELHINPTGRFVEGGPKADSGLTGRKIIVDTYGGLAHHGGGAFSGKDPTKVDRSAAYAARHAAKNIVAADLAERCEISLAYAIGISRPVAVNVETFGTARVPEDRISQAAARIFDFRPGAIIDYYNLRRPIYKRTAAEGHFGIEHVDATWEALERVEELSELLGNKRRVPVGQ